MFAFGVFLPRPLCLLQYEAQQMCLICFLAQKSLLDCFFNIDPQSTFPPSSLSLTTTSCLSVESVSCKHYTFAFLLSAVGTNMYRVTHGVILVEHEIQAKQEPADQTLLHCSTSDLFTSN